MFYLMFNIIFIIYFLKVEIFILLDIIFLMTFITFMKIPIFDVINKELVDEFS